MLQAGQLIARGEVRGGSLAVVLAGESYQATRASVADQRARAGVLSSTAPRVFSSGTQRADGAGGTILLHGADVVVRGAHVTADGAGGSIELGDRGSTRRLRADGGTRVSASGPRRAGTIELSATGSLESTALLAATGPGGRVVLDPKDVTVRDGASLPFLELLDPAPSPGERFDGVRPLPNGNLLVVDQGDDAAAPNAGAVYVFDGTTGALLSTLTGATAEDKVGSAT
ncbi:MAG: hypothetical protein R3C15_14280 [Thermoleophilia bacterium]